MRSILLLLQLVLLMLLMVGCSALAQPNASAPSAVAWGDHFDSENMTVYKSRIFRVPTAKDALAKKILESKYFVLLSPKQMKDLFPGMTFNRKEMLEQQTKAAKEYIASCEKIIFSFKNSDSEKFRSLDTTSLEKDIVVHREYEKYTKNLSPDHLTPYLVRARVGIESDMNAFTITYEQGVLHVYHGSLGNDEGVVVHDAYLVVFLEKEPRQVDASNGYVE